MKKFYLLAAMLCFFTSLSFSQSVTSLHYWDFNTGATTTAPKWPSPIAATQTIGGGILTHNITSTEDFSGSNLDAPGFTSVTGPAFCPVSNANNNNSFILNVSTAGYQDIRFTYATRGTGTGFANHVIDYSTDGTTYTNLTTITGRTNTAFTLQTADFTSVAAANNNSNFKIRVTLTGATTATGNNRFDNMRVTGTLATSNSASVAGTTNGSENPNSPVVFTVSLNNPAPAGGVTVTYRLGGIAIPGTDYTDAQNGTLSIAEGNSSGLITLVVNNDAIAEGSESVNCTLQSATNNYNFSTAPAELAITDDEATTTYSYNFNSCTGALSDGFTQFSTTGAELWACTTFGNNGGNGVQMNGFSGGANQLNEDWLISPALDLSTSNTPRLSFYSRTKFAGKPLSVLVSTNYTGSGDPALATWTEINGRFPATHSDVWTISELINLSAFKQSSVYIAFKYISNTQDGASRWTIDYINIINANAAPAPLVTVNAPLLDLLQTNFGSTSTPRSFSVWIDDITAQATATAPAGFELSKDGNTFSSSINFTPAETQNNRQTIWARFNPTSANNAYAGFVQFNSTGLNQEKLFLKGNSYPPGQTLNVVNWNIEWFGSSSAGQGPTDDNLAQANAKTIMEFLDADVYALAEIVDGTRLGNLVSSLAGGYSYVLGEFCSSGGTAAACASAQKLALVYKTSVLTNVSARPLMNNGTSSTAYANWSSGRYPFLVTGTVNKNGFTRVVNFIILHAKALDDAESYNRRKAGAEELKDTLDTYFSNSNVIILGDYNDDFDSSIVVGVSPRITPYDVLISDSLDADNYYPLTLPLSRFGLTSTFENAEVIDHVVVSNELRNSFVPFSASLLDDIGLRAGVADYANTTSDHYPIVTRFLMSGILPSKLLSFEASKDRESVKISWTTTREINSKEFVVERSADGRTFNAIGKLSAAGNSQSNRKYETKDLSPATGTNFYRLRMIDNDGKSELSKVVKVVFGKDFYFSVSPNPSKGLVNVYVETTERTSVLQLTDMNGKLVKQVNIGAGASQSIQLNLSGSAKGLYVLKLISGTRITTEKLIIE